jgi:hypothetical protein
VRGAEDEDNHLSAARKVTRKQKDVDEETKKVGKRAFPLNTKPADLLTINQSLAADEPLIFT